MAELARRVETLHEDAVSLVTADRLEWSALVPAHHRRGTAARASVGHPGVLALRSQMAEIDGMVFASTHTDDALVPDSDVETAPVGVQKAGRRHPAVGFAIDAQLLTDELFHAALKTPTPAASLLRCRATPCQYVKGGLRAIRPSRGDSRLLVSSLVQLGRRFGKTTVCRHALHGDAQATLPRCSRRHRKILGQTSAAAERLSCWARGLLITGSTFKDATNGSHHHERQDGALHQGLG